jgi:tripartite ATP-independent transporter DctM subunit
MSALFVLAIFIIARVRPSLVPPVSIPATKREKIISLLDLIPIVIVGSVIVYGILSGIFTATEAGAIGTLAVLLIGLVNRKLKLVNLMPALRATATSTGMVFIIFILAKVFSRFMNLSGITPCMIQFIAGLPVQPIFIVLGLVLMYLILGMLLDGISIIVITVPLLVPIVRALNLDMIWFAMVSIITIECGLITPPVGLNVYAVKGVAGDDISLEDLFRGSMPFFLVMVATVAFIIAIPPIITWLPALLTSR